jgi:hypothetical protein
MIALVGFGLAQMSYGAGKDTRVPSIQAWLKDIEESRARELIGLPFQLLVVASNPKKGGSQEFLKLPPRSGAVLGFFKIRAGQEAETAFRMNSFSVAEEAKQPDIGSLSPEDLGRFADANAIAYLGDGDDEARLVLLPGRGTVLELTVAPPAKTDGAALSAWFCAQLGYDGVVLGQRDNLVLVVSHRGSWSRGLQGLALVDTAAAPVVAADKRHGNALLELVSAARNFGVFRVVFAEGGEIAPGTKVAFESSY